MCAIATAARQVMFGLVKVAQVEVTFSKFASASSRFDSPYFPLTKNYLEAEPRRVRVCLQFGGN